MKSSRDDVLDLFDHVWQRFRRRMEGLADEEWRWQPGPDERLTLRWRLQHITEFLREERNGPWLGLAAESGERQAEAADAATALSHADEAFTRWRGQLAEVPEEAFAEPIGPAAGHFGDATRCSFALHVADELIHHSAEASVLRDLYAVRA
ncbi:DinB family protein [Streptomyces sp. NBC_00433]